MFWVTSGPSAADWQGRWQRLQVRIRLDARLCRSPVNQSDVMLQRRPPLSADTARHSCRRLWLTAGNSLPEQDSSFKKKVEIYLTSAAPHPEHSKYARPPGAASDFFRNDIKEKSKLFPADARPKAALQPRSHDCHRIKGNLYLTQLQNARRRFILPLQ